MISYKYECWKCDQWHNGEAKTIREANEIGKTLNVRIKLRKTPKRLRITNKGKLWLIPLPLGKGLLVGAYPRVFVAPWKTAQWEFADWSEDYSDWVESCLKAGRE